MYTAIVKMVSTEYTKNGESLPCEFTKRIWYALDSQIIIYSADVEAVEIKAKTVKALMDAVYMEMGRMQSDIDQMNQDYRAYSCGFERIK